jgi:hypothetical protein
MSVFANGSEGQAWCQRMVSLNVPELGVTGMPQAKCGAPIPRGRCPFSNDPHTGCPYLPKGGS